MSPHKAKLFLRYKPCQLARWSITLTALALCSACGGGSAGQAAGPTLTILTQPASITAAVGSPIAFSVAASGTAPLSYQWKRNGADIAGATSASLTFSPGLSDTRTKYSVNVGHAGGALTSSEATLFVTGIGVFAGKPGERGNVDGPGPTARFNGPYGLATDPAGNIVVVDVENGALRQLTPQGQVSTIAAAAGLPHFGVAVDPAGNIYLANMASVTRVSPAGSRSVLFSIDTSNSGRGYAYNIVSGIAADAAGYVYAANFAGVRRVAPDGSFVMLAGSATRASTNTGSVGVYGLVGDGKGGVYVTGGMVRHYGALGNATVLAGAFMPGTADGAGPAASFSDSSMGAALDAKGNLYLTDTDNGTIRKVSPSGVVTTVAGTAGLNAVRTGALPGALAYPAGLVMDSNGDLYVSTDQAILKIQLPPQ